MSENKVPGFTEILKLQVKAGADRNCILGLKDGRIKIKIACRPLKGEANTALVKFLSQKTGIPKSSIKLIAGERSPYKTIMVQKSESQSIYSMLAIGLREL